MKKITAFLICIIWFTGAYAYNDKIINDTSALPVKARNFIKEHFPESDISHMEEEDGIWLWKTYEVILTDGFDLEFDYKGRWTEVDCQRQPVPVNIIPKKIYQYVKTNFKDQAIVSIKKEDKGYEIQLRNGLELKFDKNEKFLRFDD